jgi:gliding motility-associated protein GldL
MANNKSFFEKKGTKKVMAILYGLGAAVVILGALFKIQHWNFANEMLILGMGTEVLIFAVSAFEPVHSELDWTKVYPQLAEGSDDDFEKSLESGLSAEEAAEMASKGLKGVELTPDVFDSLSDSLTGLTKNVKQLGQIQDAAVATNEYSDSVRSATGKMNQLNDGYTKTVDAMTSLSNSVGGAAEQAHAYHTEVQRVTKNLASLNAVYEMELQDAEKHIQAINKFYDGLGNAMNSLIDASKDAQAYRSEVAQLTKNIRDLNTIYGGMLSAMGAAAAGRNA